ncbi:hypothetical protein NYR70_05485 [Actinobacillus equuli subsp. equuli]|uniref:Uncharacterized protein n=1 Tax=Actinobacillus equuli TaxID=718 RepID=A0AAX3FHV3_ACTEU|nr:hypothetical protein [Actinobacillus equuli]AIZ79344.1 hypothetical protein ACEE_06060 [Actinobacillus equuli subsp. equuli]MDG4952586.1 hypothetical protein [Actinobacillus equuli subsp. equuli]WGE43462.1 hypothetical protein NYR65_05950 [Actinobacillus equuli subsp. equuli]WGE47717.1 hypothetical protein NYR67_05340 [Actinobacillus equuli subsp. equuli]WGE54110.1 hypothetical protein NYR70_05485 [Actinobacillus equuli subsp. equuli]
MKELNKIEIVNVSGGHWAAGIAGFLGSYIGSKYLDKVTEKVEKNLNDFGHKQADSFRKDPSIITGRFSFNGDL